MCWDLPSRVNRDFFIVDLQQLPLSSSFHLNIFNYSQHHWLREASLTYSTNPHLTRLHYLKMVTNDIATAYGDVILVLEDTARLRVSSVILSSASPVFKIMFGPTFLEGQGKRSAESPKEVSLIDDDPTTMTRLCRLLHHQLDQEFLNLFATQAAASQRAQELYNLAVLSDKYNCTDSIKMPGGYLLSQFGLDSVSQSLPSDDLLALIYAAYTMGDCRYFAFFTRCLVLDAVFNYSTIVKHHVVANLPNSFLCKFLSRICL